MKAIRLLAAGAVLAASAALPAQAASAQTGTPKCVISVTRHFTSPPSDGLYIKVSHACSGESARVLATCLHYQAATDSVKRTPERGRWVSLIGKRSIIWCRLGAYARERWERRIGTEIYTTMFPPS